MTDTAPDQSNFTKSLTTFKRDLDEIGPTIQLIHAYENKPKDPSRLMFLLMQFLKQFKMQIEVQKGDMNNRSAKMSHVTSVRNHIGVRIKPHFAISQGLS